MTGAGGVIGQRRRVQRKELLGDVGPRVPVRHPAATHTSHPGGRRGLREQSLEDREGLELAERVLTAAPIYYDSDPVVDHVYADSVPDCLSKVYQQERQQPYLWQKQGRSTLAQWLTIVGDALNPLNYLGVPLEPALLNGAGPVAKAVGRISGMLRADTASEKPRDSETTPNRRASRRRCSRSDGDGDVAPLVASPSAVSPGLEQFEPAAPSLPTS